MREELRKVMLRPHLEYDLLDHLALMGRQSSILRHYQNPRIAKKKGFDQVLHGENPCTDPVVEPVIEEENTEAEGLGMGNFVDASYGVHEVVVGDLNEDEENHMEDFEPPPVLERDLGKRYNEYKKMEEQKLYPSCEAPPSTSVSQASQPSGDMQESENVRKLPVLIDIDGVVVGDNASRWNTRAGSLIPARIPVSYTDWRLVHPDFKDKVWNALMREFEVTNVDQALARSHAEKKLLY
ncbi:hypothetical protein IFM89_033758 [Coptis chinensis]|uniref:Uncharacterized protein n=1 Tax=Coptis chinensis TaxID=261450 RepID=A0A835HRR3_9MAGN|nr:hypothetical protein IFM89_033758 [Coptis chinensis]